MANVPLTASMITNEALDVLVNNLVVTARVDRQYDDRFAIEGAKIGDTISIRKPPRYLGGEGPALEIEDFTETSVPLTLNRQSHVGLQFTSKELLLSIDMFKERVIQPAVAVLANKVDNAVTALYRQVFSMVGTPGTTPTDIDVFINAAAQLANNLAPVDDQVWSTVTPAMQAKLLYALRGLFQESTLIGEQYKKGRMGLSFGQEFAMSQNLKSHTCGPQGGAPVIDGANQTGSILNTRGWTAAIGLRLKEGDVLTIGTYAGGTAVSQVNLQSRESIGVLQQFVVTADVYSDGNGKAQIPIYPPLTPAGQYQTVDTSPVDGAAIAVDQGSGNASAAANQVTPQALVHHRKAFTLACADLPLPNNVEMAARARDPQLGLSLRFVRGYDFRNDQFVSRLDILYGTVAQRPEFAVRVAG